MSQEEGRSTSRARRGAGSAQSAAPTGQAVAPTAQAYRVGQEVWAQYKYGQYYPAKIAEEGIQHASGAVGYRIQWADGDLRDTIKFDKQIKRPALGVGASPASSAPSGAPSPQVC